MGKEHCIDITEHTGSHEIGLGAEEFLRDARPHDEGARQLLAFHQLLDGKRRHDVDGLTGIVAFAVARRPFDERLPISDARLLRGFREAIDVAAERDHRMSGAPPRHPCGRNAGDAALDREAVVFEQSGEIFRRLEFLIGKFAETENGVIDQLRQLAPCLNALGDGRFE